MRLGVALCVALGLSLVELGCANAARHLVLPRITVQNVLATSSGTPQRFRVSLLIDNPNDEPYVIQRLEFKLRLANEGILDGRGIGPVTVAALDQQTLVVDISSDIVSSLSRLLAFVQGPENTLPYEIYGTITIGRGLKGMLSFTNSGDVPLSTTGQR